MNETTTVPARSRANLRLPLGRRGMILAAMVLVGAGLAVNWGWLTALGAAPLILALAPCAVMCGLGLCMKGGSKSCASKSGPAAASDPTGN